MQYVAYNLHISKKHDNKYHVNEEVCVYDAYSCEPQAVYHSQVLVISGEWPKAT